MNKKDMINIIVNIMYYCKDMYINTNNIIIVVYTNFYITFMYNDNFYRIQIHYNNNKVSYELIDID